MNVSEARRWIAIFFGMPGCTRPRGVSDTPASDLSRSAVAADPDTPLGREAVSRLADMVRRGPKGTLQYIFGSWNFGRPLSAPNVIRVPRRSFS